MENLLHFRLRNEAICCTYDVYAFTLEQAIKFACMFNGGNAEDWHELCRR